MKRHYLLLAATLCSLFCYAEEKRLALPRVISLEVDSHNIPVTPSEEGKPAAVTIPSGRVWLRFGPDARDKGSSVRRFRYKLEGRDDGWRERTEQMRLVFFFYDEKGDWVADAAFLVSGESPGWTGSAGTAPLMARSEVIRVPERAVRFSVILTSAGPPEAVGTLALGTLKVSTADSKPVLELTFPQPTTVSSKLALPKGWGRAGTRQSMAQIVDSETAPAGRLLAVIDEDNKSHAEWQSPRLPVGVEPGGALQVEWQCCFSIGLSLATVSVAYDRLQPGRYIFQMNEVSLSGQPTEAVTALSLIVTPPFWQKAWFLVVCGMLAAGLVLSTYRYFDWRRTRRELAAMRQQQTLDRERMRIARDLHDDLGSSLTQILMLAQSLEADVPAAQEEVQALLKQIYGSALEMTVSMDEIVWALNPKNDRLDQLVAYLNAYAQSFLSNARVGFRSSRSEGLTDTRIFSPVRHHLFLSFKEALANAVRHAKCRTVFVSFVREAKELLLTVKYDGVGFDPSAVAEPGTGLENMRQRMAEGGGECRLDSRLGEGTTLLFRIPLSESNT